VKSLVLALLVTGCACGYRWDDLPGAVVTPVAADGPAWTAEVRGAIVEWNDALFAVGCSWPFALGTEGGHRVELVPHDEWSWPDDEIGRATDDSIVIREGGDGGVYRPILLHELGHAIGLCHADPAFGPSVLTPAHTSQSLTPRDVAAAACELGCGPCDSNADPYTGDAP
jgi:hypothetical protein